jgi:integrase
LLALVVEHDSPGLVAVRDRALLLVGHQLLARSSELAALEVADVAITPRGAALTIRRSKTDQEGRGAVITIAREKVPCVCPVRALEAWLREAGITAGPLFRAVDRWGNLGGPLTRKDITRRIKLYAVRLGLDPEAFSSHSLRAGGATSSALAGADGAAIQRRGRWRSPAMAARYVRIADAWADNPTSGVLSRAVLERK